MARKISFDNVNSVDLQASVDKIQGQHISVATRKTYDSKVSIYQRFLDARGRSEDVLPLNPDAIKECFAYLVDYGGITDIGYIKGILAALRNLAREGGYIESVSLVETDLKKTSSLFAQFFHGLKSRLPENLGTPVKAVNSEIVQGTIKNIIETEKNEELKSRDVLIIGIGFGCGLRGGEISLINDERIVYEPEEKRYHLKILGKTNRTKARSAYMEEEYESFSFSHHYENYKQLVDLLYEEESISEDENGKKFFITYDKKQQQWKDCRVTTDIVTRILRQRLSGYFKVKLPALTAADHDKLVKKYASHSLRRGGLSSLKRAGGSEAQQLEFGGWKKVETKEKYSDRDIVGEQRAYKKMKTML